jgi:A/G-specific adenine glycosylase
MSVRPKILQMTILTSISPEKIAKFQKTVWDFYRAHRRPMPWRAEPTPYYVMVSELMLQQTQVARVQGKFPTFICRFPTIQDLAAAQLGEVLEVWSGLGYNRRAKFLWQAAQTVVNDYNGELPYSPKELVKLPGIGLNTAGAILAYAYNEPAVFIETNIRTVFIHHFFDDNIDAVSDAELREIVAAALPLENPREWYWALMDYGTELKASVGGQLHRVKNHRPQSTFKGSRREVRGQVIKLLIEHRHIRKEDLAGLVPDDRLDEVCESLVAEGMIARRADEFYLTDA